MSTLRGQPNHQRGRTTAPPRYPKTGHSETLREERNTKHRDNTDSYCTNVLIGTLNNINSELSRYARELLKVLPNAVSLPKSTVAVGLCFNSLTHSISLLILQLSSDRREIISLNKEVVKDEHEILHSELKRRQLRLNRHHVQQPAFSWFSWGARQ